MSEIALDKIRMDGGTQPRASIDTEAVRDYVEAMQDGATFPPVTVFFDGVDYWLADGFHRIHAARQVGFKTFAAEVHNGTQREAILYAVGANTAHGKRRTNADKQRAVETLLNDEDWSGNTDRWIAEKCGVSHTLVQNIRAKLTPSVGKDCQQKSKRTGKDGKQYKAKKAPKTEVRRDVQGYEGMPVTVTTPAPQAHKKKPESAAEVKPAEIAPEVNNDGEYNPIDEVIGLLELEPPDVTGALVILRNL